ncbi:uncharacterized protein LOC142324480 [Lycorma delicatula]|uniref:uncharacterized protein LOC142324480 n=1 Tax=Lycorma delicatula TaxID=130591 RepID=UPI003F514D59
MFESKKLILICTTFLLYQFEHNVKAIEIGGSLSIPTRLGIKGETNITNDSNSIIKDPASNVGGLSSAASSVINLGTEALKNKLDFDAGVLNYGLAAGQSALNTATNALNSLTIDTTEGEKDATSNSPADKITSGLQDSLSSGTEGLKNNLNSDSSQKTGLADTESPLNPQNNVKDEDEKDKLTAGQNPSNALPNNDKNKVETDEASKSLNGKLSSAIQDTEGLNKASNPGPLETELPGEQSSKNTPNSNNNGDEKKGESNNGVFDQTVNGVFDLGSEVLKKKIDFDANLLKYGLAAGQSALHKANLGLNLGAKYGTSISKSDPFTTGLEGSLNFGAGALQNKMDQGAAGKDNTNTAKNNMDIGVKTPGNYGLSLSGSLGSKAGLLGNFFNRGGTRFKRDIGIDLPIMRGTGIKAGLSPKGASLMVNFRCPVTGLLVGLNNADVTLGRNPQDTILQAITNSLKRK